MTILHPLILLTLALFILMPIIPLQIHTPDPRRTDRRTPRPAF
jgi:hypothetical protein